MGRIKNYITGEEIKGKSFSSSTNFVFDDDLGRHFKQLEDISAWPDDCEFPEYGTGTEVSGWPNLWATDVLPARASPSVDAKAVNASSVEDEDSSTGEEFKSHIAMLLHEEFPFAGEPSKAHDYFVEQFKIYPSGVKLWIQSLFINRLFAKGDDYMGRAILSLIARLPFACVGDTGRSMALNALLYRDDVIMEYGMRAFEAWALEDTASILQNVRCASRRIEKYRQKIIADFT